MSVLGPSFREVAKRWLEWDPNPHTRDAVRGLLEDADEKAISRLLMGKRLRFGTAGLRAAMGAGYCRMNDLVVIQASVSFLQSAY
ncbi:unnamed protein product [Choristocarpus tenellus]